MAQPTAAHPVEQVAQVARYMDSVTSLLQLGALRLRVATTPAEDGSDAVIAIIGRRATLMLGAGFFAESPDDQRDTLIHEALHILLAPQWEQVRAVVWPHLPRTARRCLRGTWDLAEHQALETLAIVLAPLLPLPAFGPVPPPRPTRRR